MVTGMKPGRGSRGLSADLRDPWEAGVRQQFSRASVGDWVGDLADLLMGVDEALGRFRSSSKRLGVTGISKHTDRFRPPSE